MEATSQDYLSVFLDLICAVNIYIKVLTCMPNVRYNSSSIMCQCQSILTKPRTDKSTILHFNLSLYCIITFGILRAYHVL